MSSYDEIEKIMREITDDLYPAIDVHFQEVSAFRKGTGDVDGYENAFDIFDVLKEEILSLKKYELKLVFPGVRTFFSEMDAAIPQNIRINELHDLLEKKEERVKRKVLAIEVELEDNVKNPLGEMVSYFKENYFSKKDTFYKFVAILQKERSVKCAGKDILAPDSPTV